VYGRLYRATGEAPTPISTDEIALLPEELCRLVQAQAAGAAVVAGGNGADRYLDVFRALLAPRRCVPRSPAPAPWPWAGSRSRAWHVASTTISNQRAPLRPAARHHQAEVSAVVWRYRDGGDCALGDRSTLPHARRSCTHASICHRGTTEGSLMPRNLLCFD